MNKKWIIYIVLIVVAFVLIVVFSKNIYFWLSNQLWKILLLAAVFGGGWLLGPCLSMEYASMSISSDKAMLSAVSRWQPV